MVDKKAVLGAIFSAIDEVNPLLPPAQRLEKRPETLLYGYAGGLDSVHLVRVLVAIEQHVQEDLGVPLTLANEKAFSTQNSPFRNVDTLASFIVSQLETA